jgi:O-antigen/teichoic acid export membrane protein
MLKSLIRNTLLSAFAFFLVSLFGLIIIPVIIGAYGITEFGLIMLGRVLLPTGFMAVFDLGIAEIATQAVARARANQRWGEASGVLALLMLMAVTVGALVAPSMFLAAPVLADVLQVGPAFRDGFVTLIQWTSVGLSILFPSLVLEGVVKGFEKFPALRMLEVGTALAYVLGTLVLVQLGATYLAVAYLFLATSLAKVAVLAVYAGRLMVRAPLTWQCWNAQIRRDIGRRSFVLFQAKVLSTLQFQSVPLVISATIGPAGVGIYDMLVRLPRFMKVVLGLLNSVLLPAAARLDERTDRLAMAQRVGRVAAILVPALLAPGILSFAFFSREILLLWIGPEYIDLWPWMTAMFSLPLLQVFLGINQTFTMVDPSVTAALNRLIVVYLIVSFGLAFALAGTFGAPAFILGHSIAGLLIWPFQMRILLVFMGLDIRPLLTKLGKFVLVMTALGLCMESARSWMAIDTVVELLVAMVFWCAVAWCTTYGFVLRGQDRADLRQIVRTGLALPVRG